MASLPVCGGDLEVWAPYASDKPLRAVSSDKFLGSNVDVCQSKKLCEGVTVVPETLKALQTCGECASAVVPLNQYYGCHWCQSISARLSAYYPDGLVSWDRVSAYYETPSLRGLVDANWEGLTQCDRGNWVKKACLLTTSPGFPWHVSATDPSTSSGSSSVVLAGYILMGVVVLGLILWFAIAKWRKRDTPSSVYSPVPNEDDSPDVDPSSAPLSFYSPVHDDEKVTPRVRQRTAFDPSGANSADERLVRPRTASDPFVSGFVGGVPILNMESKLLTRRRGHNTTTPSEIGVSDRVNGLTSPTDVKEEPSDAWDEIGNSLPMSQNRGILGHIEAMIEDSSRASGENDYADEVVEVPLTPEQAVGGLRRRRRPPSDSLPVASAVDSRPQRGHEDDSFWSQVVGTVSGFLNGGGAVVHPSSSNQNTFTPSFEFNPNDNIV